MMSETEPSHSVLFVCLGNICRSPIAEAVFRHIAKERGVLDDWDVDSAATGDWHVGSKPERRAIKCMKDHNVDMDHRARLVTTEDFSRFEYIFGMDEANISDLRKLAPKGSKAQIELLGKYDPQGKTIIRDPYYDSGSQGFEDVYEQCLRCCKAFLDEVVS
ncbi:low molecular weight phosphotyrosine protein phosphatase-like [Dermacentor variabilis]|uniref:low molecular weight phosphotyrosine protein phosphatase-like n=1 Tax=Dermacentor variabilis TaxID=34621 RepID=UPI003F5BCF83